MAYLKEKIYQVGEFDQLSIEWDKMNRDMASLLERVIPIQVRLKILNDLKSQFPGKDIIDLVDEKLQDMALKKAYFVLSHWFEELYQI